MKDIWPTQAEIEEALQYVNTQMFHKEYAAVFEGEENWKSLQIPETKTYQWDEHSTYIRHPPFFEKLISPHKRLKILKKHEYWLFWVIQSLQTISHRREILSKTVRQVVICRNWV